MRTNSFKFEGINPFRFSVNYVDIDSEAPENQHEHHIHSDCEIYLNLSGDVSFMVEDHIYPIRSGSMIITRPYEYHHCIYHSNKQHKHYWILFSADGNENLLDLFFKRQSGEQNLLNILPEHIDQVVLILERMMDENLSLFVRYSSFFKLLEIMNNSQSIATTENGRVYPDIELAVQYINQHLAFPISMLDVAKSACVSLNTLERHFMKHLHMSPSEYLKRRRLSLSMELLRNGSTVSEACMQSGFTDCSSFIAYFKKTNRITPLQYKKGKS